MRNQRNLVGNKYGKLLVIKSIGQKEGNRHYRSLVRCDCGNEFETFDTYLVNNRRRQCPICSKNLLKTHGMTNSPLFHIWSGMKGRCNNPNNSSYPDYGGRGIEVCDEWSKFISFKEWALNNGYKKGLSIERKDVNGNYEPTNCCFITMRDQAKNKRTTAYVNYEGKRMRIIEVSELSGIKSGTIKYRLSHGWNDYDATHIPENSEYSLSNSLGHEIKHKTFLKNMNDGRIITFESLSEASRYLGKNVGYLSNIMRKKKSETFKAGDYIVEVQKHNN